MFEWGDDVAYTHSMVVNKVGQLAGGINFAYELQLRHDLHHWKILGVYNTVKGGHNFWTSNPPKMSLNASKWIRKVLDPNFPNWDLTLK
jgi:hypothetical protein